VTYPGVLRSRGPRVVAKTVWAAAAAAVVWLSTVGLGKSFYIEGTSEALAAERRGHTLVMVACLLLLGLAAAAWFAFEAPVWSVALLAGTALVLLVAASTGFAFLFIPLPYVALPGAAVGALWLPRSRHTPRDEPVSRD
jgi:hypothetical protein